MQLLEITEFWSFWDKKIPKSVPRTIQIPTNLDPKLVLAVQGVRRSGKSTLLLQLIERYKLDKKDCLIINFEDPRLVGSLNTSLFDEIVSLFRSRHGDNRKLYFFFDEIQNVDNWHKWIHTQIERPSNNHFIITGSNASLLSRELGSKLTGRHKTLSLYPFSYEERLSVTPELSLMDYIRTGGFPGVLESDDPSAMLRQYFDDIIQKDILYRTGLSNPQALRQLAKVLFESAGSECSYRKLSGALGISADTVSSYIEYYENAYLLFSCPFFSFSERQRIRRNNKYYPIDSAFRKSVITKTGNDTGKDFELIVFLALKRFFNEVSYWKGKNEVDFVIQNSEGIIPIQVTTDIPKERHHKGFEEFYSQFPSAKKEIFCTPDNFKEVLAEIAV